MNLSNFFLPNQKIDSITEPLIGIAIGALLKHLIGGTIFDLSGHLLIFFGCLNILYYLKKGRSDMNFALSFLILGALFLGIQIILVQVFNNWLGITPLL